MTTGCYQPRMPQGEWITSGTPHGGLLIVTFLEGAHHLLWIPSLYLQPCGQSLDTYNKVSAPAEHFRWHTTVRAGRILGIKDVTDKSSRDSWSVPVYRSITTTSNFGSQHSQSSSGHILLQAGNRFESAALLPGPGIHVGKSNPPNSPYHILAQIQGVRGSQTHKLGTSQSPGL